MDSPCVRQRGRLWVDNSFCECVPFLLGAATLELTCSGWSIAMRGGSRPVDTGDFRVPRPATLMMGDTAILATASGVPAGANFAAVETGRVFTHARDRRVPDHPDWTVDVPLRLRGRSRRGAPDVALELLRVRIGPERPQGTPTRDAVWPNTKGAQSLKRRAVDLCETALVVACLGAADPRGVGAKVSLALAAGGAARAATFALNQRRVAGTTGAETEKARHRRRGWTKHATDPNALLARLCDAAFALHVSGAALRVVSPTTHHAVKSASVLAGVRVSFSQPTRRRRRAIGNYQRDSSERIRGGGVLFGGDRGNDRHDTAATGGGVDVAAWHARYRWAALRLAPLVPPRPRALNFKNVLATLAGVVIATSSGDATESTFSPFGNGGHDAPDGSGLAAYGGPRPSGFCKRLDVSWSRGGGGKNNRSGKRGATRRGGKWGGSFWATKGSNHGLDSRVRFENLGNVTAAEILAPAVPEPASTDSSQRSSPVKSGRGGNARNAEASFDTENLENPSRGLTASPQALGTREASDPSSERVVAGDIWRDARFDGTGASTFELMTRALYLMLAFTPVFLFALPMLWLSSSALLKALSASDTQANARRAALRVHSFTCLHYSVSLCGAALVKWAQWASVRRDMFPADFCNAMGQFHDDAPKHGFAQTEKEITKHLGVPIHKIFSHFPKEPVASGSVAQVYRAVLRPEIATACAARDPEFARRVLVDQRRSRRMEAQARSLDDVGAASCDLSAMADLSARTVAVKVRHPGVARQIFLDFQILKRAARAVSGIRVFKGLNLEETLGQFSHTMTSQTDLRVEAFNLRKFGVNFKNATQVVAPWPVVGLVEEGVLCETFERGEALSSAIKRGCRDNTTTCALGVDTYLKMLLRDNFLHSDLHPGNILYHRESDFDGDSVGSENSRNQTQTQTRRAAKSVAAVKLVLLDFGIADSLPVDVRDRFLTFLFSLARKDGVAAANSLLTWSANQTCLGQEADLLREDVKELVNQRCDLAKNQVDIDDVLKRVMTLLRTRNVAIDAVFASLVVSMCVLVGFATALDENLNLFEVAIAAFLSWSVTGDVVGKLYA